MAAFPDEAWFKDYQARVNQDKELSVIGNWFSTRFSITIDQARRVSVSDTTDIAGAAAEGMDSVLVADGIFAEPLGVAPGGPGLSAEAVARLAASLGTTAPTYALPQLAW